MQFLLVLHRSQAVLNACGKWQKKTDMVYLLWLAVFQPEIHSNPSLRKYIFDLAGIFSLRDFEG